MGLIQSLLEGFSRRTAENRPTDQETEMGFFEHVDVLRKHLFRIALTLLVMTIVAFVYNTEIVENIIMAPGKPGFWTYRKLCELGRMLNNNNDLCVTAKDLDFKMVNTDISGQFTQSIFISFMSGLILSVPFILYQVWLFIRPALKPNELRHARGLVFWCSLLFIMGVLFGYYGLTPISISFLSGWKMSEQIQNFITIESYLSFMTSLTLGTGVVFELPVFVYFLTKIGLIGPEFLRKYRRHAFLVIIIVSAVVTPPDTTSMILMTIPLYALYEIGIIVSSRVKKV